MLKQAALELLYGFWKNMRTLTGICIMVVFIVVSVVMFHGGESTGWMIYIFYFPFMVGTFLGNLMGSGTGKLCMMLPITPKERKKLYFYKMLLMIAVTFLVLVLLAFYRGMSLVEFVQQFFLFMVPALLNGGLMFLRNLLPISILGEGEGYVFPLWRYLLGFICVLFGTINYDTMGDLFHWRDAAILCIVSYVMPLWVCRIVGYNIEHQMLYYDVVEKSAKKVNW